MKFEKKIFHVWPFTVNPYQNSMSVAMQYAVLITIIVVLAKHILKFISRLGYDMVFSILILAHKYLCIIGNRIPEKSMKTWTQMSDKFVKSSRQITLSNSYLLFQPLDLILPSLFFSKQTIDLSGISLILRGHFLSLLLN